MPPGRYREVRKLSVDAPERIVLVTGAASGIGAAIVRRLSAAPVRVVAFDLRYAEDPPQNIEAVEGDVRSERDIGALMAAIEARHGRLDVLVNAAGIAARTDISLSNLATWRRVMDVNYFGTLTCIAAAVPLLRRSSAAAILNIGSELVARPAASLFAYSSSNAAVVHLSKAMARELAPHGIRVNALCPGPTDTPMLRAAFARSADPRAEQEKTEASTLMSRLGTPDEIAAAAEFLVSDGATFITGAVVHADGGATS